MTAGFRPRISSAKLPNEGVTHMKYRYGAAAALASSLILLTAACSSSGSSGSGSGSSSGSGSGSSKAPYNIGLAAGITGPAAAIVKGEIEGINAAFSQVNAAGGIDGRKLNLVTSDTQNVATTAVAALTKLATENNVIASFGDILANNCQAQVPVAKAHQIALLCGTVDPEQLQPPEPYIYTEYGAEITEVDAMTSIISKPLNIAHPKVAIVYLQSSSNEPLFNAVAAKVKADGGQVVLTDTLQSQLNLSVDASKVIHSGANVVVEQIIPQQLQSLAQSLANQGSKVPIVAEATTASYQQLVLLKNPNIYELSLNPFVDPTSTEPAVTNYVNALKQQGITGKANINGQSIAITYAAAEALISALKTCGASCTNAEVNSALEKVSVNLPGINTDYSYTSGRHYPQTTFQLYQYDASKNDAVQLRDDVPSNPIPSNS